jgi:DNA-directed RNA polymerase specialized sigma24 family protein
LAASEALARFEQASPIYSRKIRSYSRQKLRNRSLPSTGQDDLENELLEVLWLCCLGYDPNAGATFNTFFWTAAENRYLDLHKAASRQKRVGDYERVWLEDEDVQRVVSERCVAGSAEEEAMAQMLVVEVFRSGRKVR